MNGALRAAGVAALVAGAACGASRTEDAPRADAMRLTSCKFTGALTSTSSTGSARSLPASGACSGDVFGRASAGVDLIVELGGGEALAFTLLTTTLPQRLTLGVPPESVSDQANFLAAEVPVDAVWARRRSVVGSAYVYTPLVGDATLDAVELAPECTDRTCTKGRVRLAITLHGVTWQQGASGAAVEGALEVVASTDPPEDAGGGGPPAPECRRNGDCGPGEECSGRAEPNPTCRAVKEEGRAVGEGCLSDSMCRSGLCQEPGLCTVYCASSDDCAAETQCSAFRRDEAVTTECTRPCERDADCGKLPFGAVCVLVRAADQSSMLRACGQPYGVAAGNPADPVFGCASRLTVPTAEGSLCTRLCVADSDCPAELPTCSAATYTFDSFNQGAKIKTSQKVCK